MSSSPPPTDRYTSAQRQVLADCAASVFEAISTSRARPDTSPREPSESLHPEENLFGLLGSRGWGKSTILSGLPEKLRCHKDPPVIVLPVIDCSAVPAEVPPGLVVIERILDLVRQHRPPSERGVALKAKAQEELNEIARIQVGMSSHFHALNVAHSSSPDDYAEYVVRGVEKRLGLRGRLASALDDVCKLFGGGAVVALLEDFDLIAGKQVRQWFQVFLDEFQQRQLFLVFTADLHRLEHLSLDRKRQFDEQTGRAIVTKLLPPRRRFEMPALTLPEKLVFLPFERTRRQDAPVSHEQRGSSTPHDETLEELLLEWFEKSTNFRGRDVILSLLPAHPRGLRALWYSLHARLHPHDTTQPRGERTLERLLATLATARGEALLTRRLEEESPTHILRAITLEPRVGPERWRETADHAGGASKDDHAGGASKDALAPLAALGALSIEKEPRDARRADDERSTLRHDPQWEDPIRKDHLRFAPLRDSDERAQPLWLEALADRAMFTTPRVCTELLQDWGAFRERLLKTAFQARFRVDTLQRELHAIGGAFRTLLPWIHWHPAPAIGDSITLEIGWYPLFRVVRGERPAWPHELLNALDLSPDVLKATGPFEALSGALVPDRIRALVLFVDALHRCPWAAYSRFEQGWPLRLWIRLAASFVRAAYLDAITRASVVDALGTEAQGSSLVTPSILPMHLLFAEQLGRRDPILGLPEGDPSQGAELRTSPTVLAGQLRTFAGEESPKTSTGHPLLTASTNYVDSLVYKAAFPNVDTLRTPPSGAG